MNQRPLKRNYGRIERERRFLLARLPSAVDPAAYVRLVDRFVDGCFLRLRRLERPDGSEILTKLGQKTRDEDAPDDPRRRRMTTIYLEPGEAQALSALPGTEAVKRRYTLDEQGLTFAIDVWEAPRGAAGVVLAEVECATDEELDLVRVPAWAMREVTDDPSFSAFELARRGAP